MWQLSFLVWFVSLKLLIFRLVITYFGTPQIAPDHTVFVKKFPGGGGGMDPPLCRRIIVGYVYANGFL